MNQCVFQFIAISFGIGVVLVFSFFTSRREPASVQLLPLDVSSSTRRDVVEIPETLNESPAPALTPPPVSLSDTPESLRPALQSLMDGFVETCLVSPTLDCFCEYSTREPCRVVEDDFDGLVSNGLYKHYMVLKELSRRTLIFDERSENQPPSFIKYTLGASPHYVTFVREGDVWRIGDLYVRDVPLPDAIGTVMEKCKTGVDLEEQKCFTSLAVGVLDERVCDRMPEDENFRQRNKAHCLGFLASATGDVDICRSRAGYYANYCELLFQNYFFGRGGFALVGGLEEFEEFKKEYQLYFDIYLKPLLQ